MFRVEAGCEYSDTMLKDVWLHNFMYTYVFLPIPIYLHGCMVIIKCSFMLCIFMLLQHVATEYNSLVPLTVVCIT